MARRVSANMSKKKAFENRTRIEIDLILKDHCSHCEEPATGKDRCDQCEIGQRLGDLYWMMQMSDPEYGA